MGLCSIVSFAMNTPSSSLCADCSALSRRDFIKTTIAAAAATGIPAVAAPSMKSRSETLVTQLYKSLSEEQRTKLCFPFDHALRHKVDANWMINAPQTELLKKDQQALVHEIFMKLHSPEYAEQVMKQVEDDSQGDGFDAGTSVALFGEPGTGKFEFVLTGRHCTRRCDGDSVEGAAFGGPIFYGHAANGFNEAPDHPGNIYWYQAKRANEVFQMLDGKQREMALRTDARPEKQTKTVALTGEPTGLPGIPMTELSADQKGHVRKVLADVLAPFREEDVKEALKLIDAAGFDHLHMAFYKNMDIGNDGVWDVWQVEGPNMLWYFRGKPHVHTWVNIKG